MFIITFYGTIIFLVLALLGKILIVAVTVGNKVKVRDIVSNSGDIILFIYLFNLISYYKRCHVFEITSIFKFF